MNENEDRLRNEFEQLLDVIYDQASEIESMRKQIDDISELVILLMRTALN